MEDLSTSLRLVYRPPRGCVSWISEGGSDHPTTTISAGALCFRFRTNFFFMGTRFNRLLHMYTYDTNSCMTMSDPTQTCRYVVVLPRSTLLLSWTERVTRQLSLTCLEIRVSARIHQRDEFTDDNQWKCRLNAVTDTECIMIGSLVLVQE